KSNVDSLPENGCQRIVSAAMLILAHQPPARAHQNKDIAPQDGCCDVGRVLRTALIEGVFPVSKERHREQIQAVVFEIDHDAPNLGAHRRARVVLWPKMPPRVGAVAPSFKQPTNDFSSTHGSLQRARLQLL